MLLLAHTGFGPRAAHRAAGQARGAAPQAPLRRRARAGAGHGPPAPPHADAPEVGLRLRGPPQLGDVPAEDPAQVTGHEAPIMSRSATGKKVTFPPPNMFSSRSIAGKRSGRYKRNGNTNGNTNGVRTKTASVLRSSSVVQRTRGLRRYRALQNLNTMFDGSVSFVVMVFIVVDTLM